MERDEQPAVQPMVEGIRSMPSMDNGENNYMLDDENDVDEHDELGIFDRERDQVIETSHVEGDVISTAFISTYTCWRSSMWYCLLLILKPTIILHI